MNHKTQPLNKHISFYLTGNEITYVISPLSKTFQIIILLIIAYVAYLISRATKDMTLLYMQSEVFSQIAWPIAFIIVVGIGLLIIKKHAQPLEVTIDKRRQTFKMYKQIIPLKNIAGVFVSGDQSPKIRLLLTDQTKKTILVGLSPVQKSGFSKIASSLWTEITKQKITESVSKQ